MSRSAIERPDGGHDRAAVHRHVDATTPRGVSFPPAASPAPSASPSGSPGAHAVSPDGDAGAFLRAGLGTDRTGLLWSLDVGTGEETPGRRPGRRCSTDGATRSCPPRSGPGASGCARAAPAYVATPPTQDVTAGRVRAVVPAVRRRPRRRRAGPRAPGRRARSSTRALARRAAGSRTPPTAPLHVVRIDGDDVRGRSPSRTASDVSWGLAEFVAAEEIEPLPRLLVVAGRLAACSSRASTRARSALVHRRPGAPGDAEPTRTATRRPARRTPTSTLWHCRPRRHRARLSPWDHDAFPYLVNVVVEPSTASRSSLLMDRRQQRQQVLSLDGPRRCRRELREHRATRAGSTSSPGTPAWWGERLLTVRDATTTPTGCSLDGDRSDPGGLQVRAVGRRRRRRRPGPRRPSTRSSSGPAWSPPTAASTTSGPTGAQRHRRRGPAARRCSRAETLDRVGAASPRSSVATGRPGAATRRSPPRPRVPAPRHAVRRPCGEHGPLVLLPPRWTRRRRAAAGADGPVRRPAPRARSCTPRGRTSSRQWIADQGFAVVVADGRGTPGRAGLGARDAPRPRRPVALDDQVAALQAAAKALPEALDLEPGRDPRLVLRRLPRRARGAAAPGRLPRRGRRRPGHRLAAVRHVLHRALPRPARTRSRRPTPRNSLLADAPLLTRPLLIIHGLADDNVVVAHTLRLSARAARGRARRTSVLPLSGVTHMTPQEVVAENLLRCSSTSCDMALGRQPRARRG